MIQGCCVAWWSIFSETEFIATVVGTLVGGGITYGMQRSAANEESRRLEQDRLEARQALGRSLLIKTLRIHSNLGNLKQYLEGCFEEARKDGFKGRPWQIVRPLASLPSPVDYTTDELSLLLQLHETDLFNRLSELDAIHNNFIGNFSTFNSLKFSLNDALPGVVSSEKTVDSPISKEQALVLGPKMHDLDLLIGNLRQRAAQDMTDAETALNSPVQVLGKHLALGITAESKPST